MGTNAARHARQVVSNIEHVVGIEVLMAVQALELRLEEQNVGADALSATSRAVVDAVRASVCADGRPIDHLKQDAVLYPRVREAREIVHSKAVLKAAYTARN